jgi:predicted MFS family arabinose efflux permease
MGLNEFAGYVAVAVVAFCTGWIASLYGLRPYPFYIGIVLVFAGLLASWLFVKDTKPHVRRSVIFQFFFLESYIFGFSRWL